MSLPGDVNRDGTVDVVDVNIVVNVMLGKPTSNVQQALSDLDHNGSVDVSDINLIINIMLGK